MDALAALGVALSLDDFGTGYSSLVRLKRLPVREVKIDSSFVGRMLASSDDEVIVRSIVDLVRALGIDSVAEGVESAEVAAALRVMGCRAAQGWYFSAPLNAASATAWLAEHGVCGARPSRLRPPPAARAPAPAPAGRTSPGGRNSSGCARSAAATRQATRPPTVGRARSGARSVRRWAAAGVRLRGRARWRQPAGGPGRAAGRRADRQASGLTARPRG